ncbi:MAG: hypothetical protein WC303_01690 [Candidatus Paceibacterota bacterium]|jgi:hypothetical protein
MPIIEFFGFSYAQIKELAPEIEKAVEALSEEPIRIVVHKTDVVDMQGISRPYLVLATALNLTSNKTHDKLISAVRSALPETDLYTKRFREYFPGEKN